MFITFPHVVLCMHSSYDALLTLFCYIFCKLVGEDAPSGHAETITRPVSAPRSAGWGQPPRTPLANTYTVDDLSLAIEEVERLSPSRGTHDVEQARVLSPLPSDVDSMRSIPHSDVLLVADDSGDRVQRSLVPPSSDAATRGRHASSSSSSSRMDPDERPIRGATASPRATQHSAHPTVVRHTENDDDGVADREARVSAALLRPKRAVTSKKSSRTSEAQAGSAQPMGKEVTDTHSGEMVP